MGTRGGWQEQDFQLDGFRALWDSGETFPEECLLLSGTPNVGIPSWLPGLPNEPSYVGCIALWVQASSHTWNGLSCHHPLGWCFNPGHACFSVTNDVDMALELCWVVMGHDKS